MNLGDLTTLDDVSEAKRELKDLKDSFYLKESTSDKSSFKSIEEVDAAIEELNKLPEIKITLAFYPSASFIKEIAKKIRSIFEPNVVLDLKVDPGLLGGITISHMGKYLDMSLRRKIDEI